MKELQGVVIHSRKYCLQLLNFCTPETPKNNFCTPETPKVNFQFSICSTFHVCYFGRLGQCLGLACIDPTEVVGCLYAADMVLGRVLPIEVGDGENVGLLMEQREEGGGDDVDAG